jgi:hypothetical protein
MVSTPVFIAGGVVVGLLADVVYDRLNARNIEGGIGLLHWLEHYHWGLLLLVLYGLPEAYGWTGVSWALKWVSSPFNVGFGVSLILDELRGATRFAYRKGIATPWYHFYESTVIGVVIGCVLVLRWLLVPFVILVTVGVIAVGLGTAAILVRRHRRQEASAPGAEKRAERDVG